jgi:hypothetical protein
MLYVASPGSGFGGHHSQPGGLAMHVAVNLTSAVHLAATYRKVYGTLDAKGLPVVRSGAGQSADGDVFIDEDIAIGAPPRFILAALWMELGVVLAAAVVAGTVLGAGRRGRSGAGPCRRPVGDGGAGLARGTARRGDPRWRIGGRGTSCAHRRPDGSRRITEALIG